MTRISLTRHYRKTADRTLTRATGQQDSGGIYDGTVGWEDGDDHFDLEDSGTALIKVTLFRGRNPDTEPEKKSARAKGQQILARIDPEKDDIPPDGCQVIVAVPAGRSSVPGAAVILKAVRPDAKFVPLRSPGEKVTFGPASNFTRMHADGSISLFTRTEDTDDGKSVYLQVRPDGFRLVHPHIKVIYDATGAHVTHSSGARIDLGAIGGLPAPLDALNSYVKLSAKLVSIEGSAINLGTAAGIATPPARSDQTLIALSAISTAAAVIAAQIGAASTMPGPGAALIATAMGNLITALSAVTPLLPSTSTMVT